MVMLALPDDRLIIRADTILFFIRNQGRQP